MARRKFDNGTVLTKKLIAQKAYTLLQKGSLNDIKTTVISEALGVTQPEFYYRYKNRAELITDVVDIVCCDIVEKMAKVNGGWEECIRLFIKICADYFERHQGIANYLQTAGPYKPAARKMVDHWVSMFLYNGFSEIDAVMATYHVNQYMLGHFSWYETSVDVGPNRRQDSPLSKLQPSDYKDTPNALHFDRLKRTIKIEQRLRDGMELIIMDLAQQQSQRKK
jgi:AcrR family transcriptional regulator